MLYCWRNVNHEADRGGYPAGAHSMQGKVMNNMMYDYLIVGSGAGGSAAAYRLAQTGKTVLLVEKGRALPSDGSTLDVDKVLRQGVFKNHEPWVDKDGATVVPQEFFNLGGKTKWYGAALLRFSPHEFAEENSYQCRPWPIRYEDLASFYDEAERLLGVRTFSVEPDMRAIVAGLERRDPHWHDQPMPIGLAPDILEHPEEAKHFDGFASPLHLKSDAEAALLDKVKHLPNLHVVTGREVVSLQGVDGQPHVINGVVCDDGSRFRAGTVLLAAGALHSPRLLQRYVEENGLTQRLPGYRLIGRFYKCHLNTAMMAFSPSAKTDVLRKTVLLLNDAFPHSSVQALGGWLANDIVGTEMPAFVPRWFADLMGRRAYGFFLTTEDGSHLENRVAAKANGADRPQLNYDPARIPAAWAEHRHLVHALRRRLLGLGFLAFYQHMPLDATAHACGTLVTGKDPAESVVDEHGKVHGMEDLYVVDGSVLPRSSRVNPALTIYAWALRVGAALAAQPLPAGEAAA
jgi:choline dehydrogenase-like flavoprotein